MRVLAVHNYYRNRGGEARTLGEEKKAMEAHGHKVHLYTRDNREISDSRFLQFWQLAVNVFFSIKTYREVIKLIRRFAPDVVHIHNVFPLISPSVYFAVKRCRIPMVQTLHNYRLGCPNGLFLDPKGAVCEKCLSGNVFHAVLKKCLRGNFWQSLAVALSLGLHRMLGTFRKVDMFISPSRFLKVKMMEAGIPEEKIRVKPHFMDTNNMSRSLTYEPYAVFMGRLSREKGVMTLLQAFKGRKGLGLKIIGEGPLLDDARRFIDKNRLSHVECLGYISSEKRFNVVKRAAFMLFPSLYYENFPYVLMESLSLGVPVIASSIGGVPELIEDKQNGLLYSPGSVKEMNNQIDMLLRDASLLAGMRKQAGEKADIVFNEKKGYRQLLDVYRDVMKDMG
ncbi:MAG: glycosyltransferase family 4 protein [Candidatus Aminicenantes bacterium]|nr:glycosyltransferase family 4 protein [Candidatus Aminicenantes bacterium]